MHVFLDGDAEVAEVLADLDRGLPEPVEGRPVRFGRDGTTTTCRRTPPTRSTRAARSGDGRIRSYHDRPARVLMADRFTDALLAGVTHPQLRALPPVGGVDQLVDSTDARSAPAVYRRLGALYGSAGA